MIKASLRGLLHRKLRLVLALFAIVLSVAFLAGSMVLTDTLSARFTALFTSINENVAVQIQAKDSNSETPARLTAAQVRLLSQVDGVAAISPEVSSEGVVPFRKRDDKAVNTNGAPNIGVGVTGDDPLGLVRLAEGAWPHADEVAVSRYTATTAGVTIGDQLKVYLPRTLETKQFKVVGIVVYPGDRASLGGETLLLFEQAQAQQFFYGQTDAFAAASLSAKDGISQDELKRRVSAAVPLGFEAKTGEELTKEQSSEIADVFTSISNYFFLPFVLVSVLVGIFLIYNTFNIIVAQRARELALLRALGAGWGQVTGTVLLEAVIVGGVGATIGLLAGIGVGGGGEKALTGLLSLDLPSGGLIVSGWTVLWSYVVGVMVTVIAAFVPAIRASSVPPIAAMRETVRPDKSLKALSIVGLALAVPGGGLLALALSGTGGFPVLAGGVLLIFFGIALLSPLLSRPIVRVLGRVVAWGQAGKLGVRNTLRNPRRTAVTAAALMIGVTLVSTAGVVAQSFKTSIEQTVTTSLGAEIMIQGPQNAPPTGESGFDPKALERVRALPEVERAVALHLTNATVDGAETFVAATDVGASKDLFSMEVASGELRTLRSGELIVDENTAKDAGWTVGKQVTVKLHKGDRSYTVVGLYKTSPLVQGIILDESAVAAFTGPLAAQGYVKLRDGADAAAALTGVEKIMSDYPLVTVGDRSSYVKQANATFDLLLGVITVLLAVAILIALLGILNTLLLSIVERTRELGLVRAIGLSRGGVVRMVGVESVLIAIFGCLLGMGLGIGLGSAFVSAMIKNDIITTLALPWTTLAVYLVVAVVAGVIAALWPAWRAARLNVLEAIAYE